MTPIRMSRIATGMTQGEFAKKLGVSQVTVCRWEMGYGFPKVSRLKEVADLLGVSVLDLLGDKERRIG